MFPVARCTHPAREPPDVVDLHPEHADVVRSSAEVGAVLVRDAVETRPAEQRPSCGAGE